MKQLRLFTERTVKILLTFSGSITSLAILLIIIFLFIEGLGLFNSSSVEKGYSLCVNASNPVSRLTPYQIKHIFDEEITNWNNVNGNNVEITTFRFDEIFSLFPEEEFGEDYEFLPQKLGEVIGQNSGIIAYIPQQYLPDDNSKVKILPLENIRITDFFGGMEWLPTATPSPLFGVLPLILGTLLVSFFAILIALPLGLGVAIYMSELASSRVRKLLKPAIELLAGIPSVV